MGLKISKFLKKNVSFKNAVKLTGIAVPGVAGSIIQGLQASAEAKKAARNQKAAEQANLKAQQIGEQIGAYGGTVAGNVIKGATKKVLAGASQGANEASGIIGAKVLDNTIVEWVKSHKSILIGAVVSILAYLLLFRRKPQRKRGRYA